MSFYLKLRVWYEWRAKVFLPYLDKVVYNSLEKIPTTNIIRLQCFLFLSVVEPLLFLLPNPVVPPPSLQCRHNGCLDRVGKIYCASIYNICTKRQERYNTFNIYNLEINTYEYIKVNYIILSMYRTHYQGFVNTACESIFLTSKNKLLESKLDGLHS